MIEQIDVLDHGFLALDGYLADDLAVANAARVSFNAHSDQLTVADEGLINFLAREHHGTPFEHTAFRWIVKCPIFTAREWMRHRWSSFNEWSGRYSKIEPEFYRPEEFRTQVGKPGAYTFEPLDHRDQPVADLYLATAYKQAADWYEELLDMGVAKEQARMVLPVATYTKFMWTCNARALMHFLGLRNSDQAQWEIREYAKAAEQIFKKVMPVTARVFEEHGRVSP